MHLYTLAFQHKSIHRKNNERLEFLGDAIIDAVISNILYFQFPNKNEGELSKIRSKIVNRNFLNQIGKSLEIEKWLKYKLHSSTIDKTNIWGNTFEALIGAIYLDQGFAVTDFFLKDKIVKKHIDWQKIDSLIIDFKSKLINYAQKHSKEIEFELLSENKEAANSRIFEIAIKLDSEIVGKGKGTNKKKAEQNASKDVLGKFEK